MQGEGDEMLSSVFSDSLLLRRENDLIDKITKQNIPYNWIYRDKMLKILSIDQRLQINLEQKHSGIDETHDEVKLKAPSLRLKHH